MDLSTFKQRFDVHLEDFLGSALGVFTSTLGDPALTPFVMHAKDLALAGGKRIRPYLSYVMAEASGYPEDELMRAGLAWEVFHLFALVHDDVMDGGKERHGIATAHAFLDKRDVSAKLAEGQAILLGDLLFSLAHQALLSIGERGIITRDQLHVAHTIFGRMSREVIAGQMADINLTAKASTTFQEIEKRNFLKTSSYTFIRPMQFGAAINGDNAKVMQFCTNFGTSVGQAFQLQDDLLDVRGEGTGKTAMRDLREGQHTALTQCVFEHGTPEQKKFLKAHMGVDFPKKDEELLKKLFEETKAFAYVEGLIAKSYDTAEGLLEEAELSKASREQLGALVGMLKGRTA